MKLSIHGRDKIESPYQILHIHPRGHPGTCGNGTPRPVPGAHPWVPVPTNTRPAHTPAGVCPRVTRVKLVHARP